MCLKASGAADNCVCVCVCERERWLKKERTREGERKRESVCLKASGAADNFQNMRERERESERFGEARRTCGVLQCVAVCCSVLQCVAVCCSSERQGAHARNRARGKWTEDERARTLVREREEWREGGARPRPGGG